MNAPKRRFLIPETVQSSAMDCGPAVLCSLLAGFGIEAAYGRLREACQTGIDGTSIAAIEELATASGLEAEQVMVPAEDLLIPSAQALPAVVVVLAGGVTHFVVLWRRHGSRLQVMDPATGRRWPSARRFLDDVYVHQHEVAAADWRQWSEGPEATAIVRSRLSRLGAEAAADRIQESARAVPGWLGLAALDAATRLCDSLSSAGAIRRGPEATRLVERLAVEAAAADRPEKIVPARFWSVRPATVTESPASATALTLRGAVLVRALGRRQTADSPTIPSLPGVGPRLGDSVAPRSEPGPMRRLLGFLRQGGRRSLMALGAAAAVASLLAACEALLLNGLLRIADQLGGTGQLPGALAVLLAFAAALALLELTVALGARDLGRGLEARLRVAFLEKIPRLGERWFRSRLPSDLAERAHSAVWLRTFPAAVLGILGAGCELAVTALALGWLFPGTAPLAVLAAVLAVAVPLALQPFLGERELRMRHHGAALARLQLDALLGLLAVRSHGAEPLVRRQHDEILEHWQEAGTSQLRGALAAMVVQSLVGYGMAAALVGLHVADHGIGGGALLLAYWALKLPELGGEIAAGLEQIPSHRSVAVRMLEPLGAPDDESETGAEVHAVSRGSQGVAISLHGVSVTGAGGPVLEGLDLEIGAGRRVAVLGPSGAGKSTLLGLLLGLQTPAEGETRIDGELLDAVVLARLRAATAWVDPGVRLWNRPLLDNLRYGAESRAAPLADLLSAAELVGVLEELPEGLATRLGEGGGLVSGGEGQRVRFGRALGRPAARLVLLDEPFRGLDRAQRTRLLQNAREWWPRATLICATHDAASVRDFDQMVILDGGRIVEAGEPAKLAVDSGSRYGRLLEKEAAAWADPDWRRLHLVDGCISASPVEAER